MLDIEINATMPELNPEDWGEVAKRVAQIMLDGVREQFVRGGIPGWQPLKSGGPSYLYQGGALLQGIESSTGSDGSEFWAMVATTGGLPYASIHQFSGWAGRGHKAYIPARPYMVMTDETQSEIIQEAAGMIVEFLNAEPENRKGGKE